MGISMQSEAEFREWLAEELRKRLQGYVVRTNANLIYRVVVDEHLNYVPADPKNPARGQFAFQTDILIERADGLPLVVIETKYGQMTTHDVLTYSTKELKHKDVYPHLRYGIIIGNYERLDRRLFIHNSGFDFAYAIASGGNIAAVVDILRDQISAAEQILEVIHRKNSPKGFSTRVEMRW